MTNRERWETLTPEEHALFKEWAVRIVIDDTLSREHITWLVKVQIDTLINLRRDAQ